MEKAFVLDAEFGEGPFGLPDVRCFVIYNCDVKKYEKFWLNEFDKLKIHRAFQKGSLLVAYYALAELESLKAIGVKVESEILDLFLVAKSEISKDLVEKYSLLAVCDHYGIKHIESSEKDEMRDLALRGAPYTDEEAKSLLNYCKGDVELTVKLFEKMESLISRSIRGWGEYLKLVCKVQSEGIPVNSDELNYLLSNRDEMKLEISRSTDLACRIFENGKFVNKNFESYLKEKNLTWVHTPSGILDLKEKTFQDERLANPEIYKLGRTRKYINALRKTKLKVEENGRVYSSLGPFGSLTGRNQPPGSKHILLHPSFFRGFISPKPNTALIYADYSQQEFGIAASLSGDKNMQKAFTSGDPYLSFAKFVGAVPETATKASHPEERGIYKQAILAVQYGMGPASLAKNIKKTELEAKRLLVDHEKAFPTFWNWSRNYVEQAQLRGYCRTKWGWKLPICSSTKEKTIANFPMQAGGSDILRQAMFLLDEAGLKTIAPLHDAVLVEVDVKDIEESCTKICNLMEEASRDYLSGFTINVEAKVIKENEHFPIERGLETWEFLSSKIQKGVSS